MKTLIALLAVLLVQPALALTCSLPESYDEAYEVVGQQVMLTRTTSLTPLEVEQVVTTAKAQAARWGETLEFTREEAVTYLMEGSESETVYLETLRAGESAYDVVEYFPGGNPYGVIFEKGTAKVLAFIEDSTVTCAN